MPIRLPALAAFALVALVLPATPHAQTRGTLHVAALRSGPPGGTPGASEPVFALGLGGGIEHALALPAPAALRLGLGFALAPTGRSEIQLFTDAEGEIVGEFSITTRPLYLTATPSVALQLARGPVQPYVVAGPVGAVKLGERTSQTDGLSELDLQARTTDVYPDRTTGATAGVGVHVPGAFPLGALRVEIRATRLAGRADATPEFRDRTAQRTVELQLGLAL